MTVTVTIAGNVENMKPTQGFSYLSEVGGQGPVEFGKRAFGPSKLGNFDAV